GVGTPPMWTGSPLAVIRRILFIGLTAAVALTASPAHPSLPSGGATTDSMLAASLTVAPSVAGGRDVVPSQTGVRAIDYFTSGAPPVRWNAEDVPVTICTSQANRPSSISAMQFREAVANAASMWNQVGAAVGYRYIGDCPRDGR